MFSDKSRFRPKNSEVDRLWCNNNKAKKLLNWEPKLASIVGLREGLKKTIGWFKKKDNLAKYKSDIYNI